MARQFAAQRGATRVVFGEGSAAAIHGEIAASGFERVLVVSSAGRAVEATRIGEQLGARSTGVLAIAREHVPIEIAREARAEAERTHADAVLAFGGGSAIGLAKAVALAVPVRVIALPTTYSGSEMTPIFGISEAGEKKTGRDPRVRPSLVVYDPSFTWALPRDVTVTSLWNAMAHAAEALWIEGIDRAAALTAEEALRLIARSMRALVQDLDDKAARSDALEGAYLAGAVLGDIGTGIHHKLCHALGGQLGLPHAATHAVLLPHVARLMAPAAPEAMAAIARALGVVDPVGGLFRLARATGSPLALESLGMPRDGIARVVDALFVSPQRFARAELVALLERAHTGAGATPEPPALVAPADLQHQPGLGSTHESEALPDALPRRQNAPRHAPYGLYPELVNGTPFTVRSADNSRVWMYRVRPTFSHSELAPLPSARFAAELEAANPNRQRWKPLPIPRAPEVVDFLDGLVTLGGAGAAGIGPGYRVHLYAANASMNDRCFFDADGDLLIVPQEGTLECRTELGWLRAAPGTVLLIPRAIKFAIGLPEGAGRGWMLEVFGRRLRLPERGPIGSNGLADARHFLAPTAAFEDRLCPGGFELVTQLGGRLYSGTQAHSPFDVVAWHGNHVPFSYDLSLFNAMGSVTWDHPDPSILTVLTAPLDDHGRATADFVVFPGRWQVIEHSFRPPFMHRNAASEINVVIHNPGGGGGYTPGCTFVTPLLSGHGISTKSYDHELDRSDEADVPERIPDASLWAMFESALPFASTRWAEQSPQLDRDFLSQFEGMKKRFDPSWRKR